MISKRSSVGKKWWIVPLLSGLYLLTAGVTSGIRGDHLLLVAVVNSLYYISSSTRRFLYGFSIFIVYWIIYDGMKLVPNNLVSQVDIKGIYLLEKRLFGIRDITGILTPNEYFHAHPSLFLDLFCSLFYLCWVPVPLGFALYLWMKQDKKWFLKFSFAFFVTNLIGFCMYYLHPAAPPWYVQEHGFLLDPSVKTNAAGLLRFDNYFHFPLFATIYTKGSNVFGAMPSLHSAYPVVGFYYAIRMKSTKATIFFAFVMTGIWFSAVYLMHHYLVDVIAGILCAILGIILLELILFRIPRIQKLIQNYQGILENR